MGIKEVAEDIRKRVVGHVNSCSFTLVAVDEHRKPTLVAPLGPTTPDDLRRHAAAELRRQMRREMEQRFSVIRDDATRQMLYKQ